MAGRREGVPLQLVMAGREGPGRALAVHPHRLVAHDLAAGDVVADEVNQLAPSCPASTSWKASSTSALISRWLTVAKFAPSAMSSR